MKARFRSGAAAIGLAAFVSVAATHSTYGSLISFGDSLSDVGNLYLATGGTKPAAPPYSNGRFSNGPVWTQYLAQKLGEPQLGPSLLGGSAYAFGGAQAAGGPELSPPTLRVQVGMYLSSHTPAPNDLIVLWSAANDLFNGQTDVSIPAAAIQSQVGTLATAGARRFVVLNLPPLGQTPQFRNTPYEQPMNALSQAYNAALAADLNDLKQTLPADVVFYDEAGDNDLVFDVYGLFQKMFENPANFGLTNVTDPVLLSSGQVDASTYLFFDTIHPTTKGHEILSGQVASVIPEPASVGTLLLGAACLILGRRRAA